MGVTVCRLRYKVLSSKNSSGNDSIPSFDAYFVEPRLESYFIDPVLALTGCGKLISTPASKLAGDPRVTGEPTV